MRLTDAARASLDRTLPVGRLLRAPRSARKPPTHADGDVRLVMGRPGAGKTTLAHRLVEDGYARLNRDELGGRLRDLIPRLDDLLARGHRRIVLDNTYGLRSARNEVLECAWNHGVPVRCTFVDTSLERAQVHVVSRLLARYGRLLEPDELTRLGRADPAVLAPSALFRFERTLELPHASEGYAAIERVTLPPEQPVPAMPSGVLFDLGSVRPTAGGRLRAFAARGFVVGAFGWTPDGDPTEEREACRALLGMDIGLWRCAHPPGPPICWCRPPLPGLPLAFARHMHVDLRKSVLIGGATAHRTLARRVGMQYMDPCELEG